MPAGNYRRYFSPNNYLARETQTFFFAGGEMPFEKEKLPGSFILELLDVPERDFPFSRLRRAAARSSSISAKCRI